MARFTKAYIGKEVNLTNGTTGRVAEIADRYGNLAYIEVNNKPYLAEFSEVVRIPKSTWKHGRNYYKNDFSAPANDEEFLARIENAKECGVTSFMDYENPYALQFLYYTEGLSLKDMGELFECDPKTVSRWMNYYGFERRRSGSALAVFHHGPQMAELLERIRYNKCYTDKY